MNYCTKCESFYQKAGTCNCFAGTQPAQITPWRPVDGTTTTPFPSYTPWIYPTVTWGTGSLIGNAVNASSVLGQSSCNVAGCFCDKH